MSDHVQKQISVWALSSLTTLMAAVVVGPMLLQKLPVAPSWMTIGTTWCAWFMWTSFGLLVLFRHPNHRAISRTKITALRLTLSIALMLGLDCINFRGADLETLNAIAIVYSIAFLFPYALFNE